MWRFTSVKFDQGGAGGGSTGLAEIPKEGFKTAGDISNGFAQVAKRFDQMQERYGKLEQFNPDDFSNLRKRVEDLVKGQEAFVKESKERKVGYTEFVGTDADFLARVSMLTMPFDVDKELPGCTREYFNVVAYHPDELTYAATAVGSFLPGMSPVIQRHLQSGQQSFSSFDRQVKELQGLNDAIFLMDAILSMNKEGRYWKSGNSTPERMKTLKLWPRWAKTCDVFQRAISGGGTVASGTGGGAWLPQMFSSLMHDLVQLETRLWNQFPILDMPGKVYTSPVLLADGQVYLIPENPSSQGGAGGAGTAVTESTPQTTNMTLTAVKLAARMFTSTEAEEDLLVPIMPFLLRECAKVTARGLDDAVLNADTTGTHMDASAAANAPTGTDDRRKAWPGLRALVIQGSGMPLVDISANTDAAFLSMKQPMQVYGVNPNEGFWTTSITGLFRLMQATDGQNNKLFIRYDMLGLAAQTVLNSGVLGSMFGSPVILSEFCPDDTQGSTGKRLSANSKSTVIYANKPAFQRGQRRVFTVNISRERHIELDQDVLVSTWRGDFKPWFTTASGANPIVSVGRNFN